MCEISLVPSYRDATLVLLHNLKHWISILLRTGLKFPQVLYTKQVEPLSSTSRVSVDREALSQSLKWYCTLICAAPQAYRVLSVGLYQNHNMPPSGCVMLGFLEGTSNANTQKHHWKFISSACLWSVISQYQWQRHWSWCVQLAWRVVKMS